MTSAALVAQTLLRAGAVALRPAQPFRFASGLLAPIYCDNRLLIGDVAARRVISDALAEQLGQAAQGVDLVAGTATAGIAWAAWVAERLGLPMAYVRSAAKGHGKGKQIEGGALAGQRAVLIEDTVSTGGSALAAVHALQEAGLQVEHCCCIFSYQMAEALAAFQALGMQLQPLTTLEPLLDTALAEGRLTPEERVSVEAWAADPQAWSASRDQLQGT